MAELTLEQKQAISHRGHALRALVSVLRGMLRERKGPEITIGPKRATSGSPSEQNWVEGFGLVERWLRRCS